MNVLNGRAQLPRLGMDVNVSRVNSVQHIGLLTHGRMAQYLMVCLCAIHAITEDVVILIICF